MKTETESRWTNKGENLVVIEKPWRPPSSVPAKLAEQIPALIDAYRDGMKPGRKDYLTGRVTVMLAQYFVPDMPFELQALLLADWVDCLNEFPSWAVKAACDRWRDTERRKPTPADIRAICLDLVKAHRTTLERLQILSTRQPLQISGSRGATDAKEGEGVLAHHPAHEDNTRASQDFRLNGLLSGALQRMPGTGHD